MIGCKSLEELQSAMEEYPQASSNHPIKHGWWMFPMNFDPVWGPDKCAGYREYVDQAITDMSQNSLITYTRILEVEGIIKKWLNSL